MMRKPRMTVSIGEWPPQPVAPIADYDRFAWALMDLWRRLNIHRIAGGLSPFRPTVDLRDRALSLDPTVVGQSVGAFVDAWNSHAGSGIGDSLKVHYTISGWMTYTLAAGKTPADGELALWFYDDPALIADFNIQTTAGSMGLDTVEGVYRADANENTVRLGARRKGWHEVRFSASSAVYFDGVLATSGPAGTAIASLKAAMYALTPPATGTLWLDDMSWASGGVAYSDTFATVGAEVALFNSGGIPTTDITATVDAAFGREMPTPVAAKRIAAPDAIAIGEAGWSSLLAWERGIHAECLEHMLG
jgi:hypothetical protein